MGSLLSKALAFISQRASAKKSCFARFKKWIFFPRKSVNMLLEKELKNSNLSWKNCGVKWTKGWNHIPRTLYLLNNNGSWVVANPRGMSPLFFQEFFCTVFSEGFESTNAGWCCEELGSWMAAVAFSFSASRPRRLSIQGKQLLLPDRVECRFLTLTTLPPLLGPRSQLFCIAEQIW